MLNELLNLQQQFSLFENKVSALSAQLEAMIEQAEAPAEDKPKPKKKKVKKKKSKKEKAEAPAEEESSRYKTVDTFIRGIRKLVKDGKTTNQRLIAALEHEGVKYAKDLPRSQWDDFWERLSKGED